MKNKYIIYGLTFLSSYLVYFMFGVILTVSSSYSLIPFISFAASIIQFGVGSWLFLFHPKAGRLLAVVLGVALSVWPLWEFVLAISLNSDLDWGLLIFALPPLLSALVIYGHVKNWRNVERPSLKTRIALSIIPAALFICYVGYVMLIL